FGRRRQPLLVLASHALELRVSPLLHRAGTARALPSNVPRVRHVLLSHPRSSPVAPQRARSRITITSLPEEEEKQRKHSAPVSLGLPALFVKDCRARRQVEQPSFPSLPLARCWVVATVDMQAVVVVIGFGQAAAIPVEPLRSLDNDDFGPIPPLTQPFTLEKGILSSNQVIHHVLKGKITGALNLEKYENICD
ncbi:tudor domain-containing protein 10, partial [Glossophaga mutica]